MCSTRVWWLARAGGSCSVAGGRFHQANISPGSLSCASVTATCRREARVVRASAEQTRGCGCGTHNAAKRGAAVAGGFPSECAVSNFFGSSFAPPPPPASLRFFRVEKPAPVPAPVLKLNLTCATSHVSLRHCAYCASFFKKCVSVPPLRTELSTDCYRRHQHQKSKSKLGPQIETHGTCKVVWAGAGVKSRITITNH